MSAMSNVPTDRTTQRNQPIPRIDTWVEGLIDCFNTRPPSDQPEHTAFGFALGKQVVGLYIVEVLLKYTREKRKRPYRHDHNLRRLFSGLSPRDKKRIEDKYQDIVRSSSKPALDIESSASRLLTYLGNNPITRTRYFWEHSHPTTPSMSILVAPHMLTPLLYAILIQAHKYPANVGKNRHRPKEFIPRSRWIEGNAEGGSSPAERRPGLPGKDWMLGLRKFFGTRSARSEKDPRRLGFAIGLQIVGLYLTEMTLKFALDERSISYAGDHNLGRLFSLLPGEDKERLRARYKRILHSEPGHAWDFQQSIDSLLRHLDEDPFTEARYFWDGAGRLRDGVLFAPDRLIPLVDGVLSELHAYEVGPPETEFFDKQFESFELSIQ